MTIYTSHWDAPALPETSIFTYIFPDSAADSPLERFDPALPAFISPLTETTVSRGQLKENALRIASGLRKLGLKKYDTACVWGANSLPWINAVFGLIAAGVAVTPANVAYEAHEFAHQVNDSGSTFIFVDPANLATFEKAKALFKHNFSAHRIVLLCRTEDKPKVSPYKSVYELFGEVAPAERFDGQDAQSPAWLCYSSGTTGLPKGVVTTHHNLTSQLQALNVMHEPLKSGKDSVLGILPMSHIYGAIIVLLQPLTVGVPVVVLPKFEEASVYSAIQKHKITFGLVVPPILIVMLHSQTAQNYDLSSIRTLQSGAAPLSQELCAAYKKRYPTFQLIQGYGMTETSPVIMSMAGPDGAAHEGQCGRLIPTWEARLVKEDGEDASKPGEAGELWVRGPSTMKGYHNNKEANDKSFAEGRWFKTGDVLTRTEDGWYQVVDRVKELIKYKGFQVPPAELEALLLTNPDVVDVGVIGVWDESQATELPKDGIPKFERDIGAWVAARVAPQKKLRGGVVVIPAIPKSPSGKILRKDLRKRAEEEIKAAGGFKQKARL
ncbi:hypothetical protein VHUM_01265 [Vanrija humicola]|uniref:AMP-dependent synthetase/ligase domain-containing protein n=1 Tax=Vanrija humicola TaxID=5417 RepID=A0A7D8V0G5_VANHU|nr:hypothetical protein VHUM_01265 [Vanrija humicola]